jgi:hypothetical protein
MQPINQVLNGTAKTNYDPRNNEARSHEGHELHVLRSKHMQYPLSNGYNMLEVICETCSKQYKAYNWGEK